MRILVISDSHGDEDGIEEIIRNEAKFDMLIHAGDVCGGEDYIKSLCRCEAVFVAGNCDYVGKYLPEERIITVMGHKIYVVHGHQYGVYNSIDRLYYKAKEIGAKVCIFGHIHEPYMLTEEGVTIINPGSISKPRQSNHRKSYIVLDIKNDLTIEQKYI